MKLPTKTHLSPAVTGCAACVACPPKRSAVPAGGASVKVGGPHTWRCLGLGLGLGLGVGLGLGLGLGLGVGLGFGLGLG